LLNRSNFVKPNLLDENGKCHGYDLDSWNDGTGFQPSCHTGSEIRSQRTSGRPVILAFYPADWSPVCGDQMALYNEILPEFQKYNAELLGISVDGAWCHEAFAKDRNLHFPLLADFEPKGAVARSYGAYRKEDGFCERALFVIDSDGVITWSYCSPIAVNPGADGILDALERLPKKE
jgi:peroxiredoxin